MGPIKRTTTSSTAQYIIAAVDHFTKWVEAKVISFPTAKVTVSYFISNIIARHGFLQIIFTDNGTNFSSKLIGNLN